MNIGRLADDNIQRFGEYDFLYYDGRWHTNVAMNNIANKLGNALKNMGIKKGDRVGVQLLNGSDKPGSARIRTCLHLSGRRFVRLNQQQHLSG